MRRGEEEVADDHVPQRIGSASMDCLPDDLLVKILSLLPTKQAASTSILAKRWKTLYTFNDNLDFDNSTFLHPEVGNKKDRHIIFESFKEFVDRTLALKHDRYRNKFSLRYIGGDEKIHIDRWICNALEHNVSELHLSIYSWSLSFVFPSKVFTSTTLVKLSLGKMLNMDSFPPDTFLPSLKVLYLETIRFKEGILSDVLLVACPSLEELTIYDDRWSGTPIFISSKTIKRLSITFKASIYFNDKSIIISLDTPSIVDLYYFDHAHRMPLHCNFDSLAKATLDLHFSQEDYGRRHRGEVLDMNVMTLIRGIRNVKTLHLTSSAVEVISICLVGELPMFNNLVELVFSSHTEQGWKVLLPLLVEHSPNLKTLVISGMNHCSYRSIPTNNQVKILRIMQCGGSCKELKHIERLLLKMESLEVLRVYMDDSKNVQLFTELLMFPMASSSKVKIRIT